VNGQTAGITHAAVGQPVGAVIVAGAVGATVVATACHEQGKEEKQAKRLEFLGHDTPPWQAFWLAVFLKMMVILLLILKIEHNLFKVKYFFDHRLHWKGMIKMIKQCIL